MKRFAVIAALCALAMPDLARKTLADDALAPPPGSNLLLAASADGVQVYVCVEGDKGYAWVFDGPSASLFNDEGRQIGTHGKGPIWTLSDGSAITAELSAKKAAPEPGAVLWLLLEVKAHLGTFGMLSTVNYVRRSDTKGGAAPPDGCDRAHAGDIARMRYSAVYQFYGR